MRVLALDLGTRRIGVAVSDPGGILASPAGTIERARHRGADHRAVEALVADLGVARVIVGLPLSLDGRTGPAAEAALAEADQLRDLLAVPVETWDERLTTVSADRSLRAGGSRRRAPARRRVIDQAAAAVLLQSWLDGRRGATG